MMRPLEVRRREFEVLTKLNHENIVKIHATETEVRYLIFAIALAVFHKSFWHILVVFDNSCQCFPMRIKMYYSWIKPAYESILHVLVLSTISSFYCDLMLVQERHIFSRIMRSKEKGFGTNCFCGVATTSCSTVALAFTFIASERANFVCLVNLFCDKYVRNFLL